MDLSAVARKLGWTHRTVNGYKNQPTGVMGFVNEDEWTDAEGKRSYPFYLDTIFVCYKLLEWLAENSQGMLRPKEDQWSWGRYVGGEWIGTWHNEISHALCTGVLEN